MTGMIHEETIGDHSVNAAWLAKLRAENPRIVAEYKGFAIQMTESAVFAEDEYGLSFLFAYTTEQLFGRAVTKATADRRGGNVPGMAGYIFWHALFPLQNAVMAGEGYSIFWADRACEAFERGAQVCFVEVSSGSIKHVADADTFQALGGRLWGYEGVSARAKALRIVISQEPIQGRGELRLEDLEEQNPRPDQAGTRGMKRTDIRPGDRLFVRPWLSTTREHWGTFSHCNRGGLLVYAPDPGSTAYSSDARLRRCCWREVEQIVRAQVGEQRS